MVSNSTNESALASLFTCCTSCHIRKQGLPWPGGAASSEFEKRVLLLGKSESGKSRLIDCLRDPISVEPGKSSAYQPTNGTLVSRVVVAPLGLTLVEVGGKLSEFWHRSIDSKIDGIWYLVSAEEVSTGDFSTLTRFLRLACDVIVSRRLPILISSSVPNLSSLIDIEQAGVPLSRVCFVQTFSFDRSGLQPALDQLKRSLI